MRGLKLVAFLIIASAISAHAVDDLIGIAKDQGQKVNGARPAAADLVPSLFDFHTHSYCSDGNKTPLTLAQEAKAAGLKFWQLSDHDTIACLKDAKEAAATVGIKWFPGVEMSAEDDTVHIVAININPNSPELNKILDAQKKTRLDRLDAILAGLKKANVILDRKLDVLLPKRNQELSLDGKPLITDPNSLTDEELLAQVRGQVTRPDMAAALVRKGYVKDKQEAFSKYIANGGPGDVPMNGPSFKSVIDAIHAAGGKAVQAHPYTIKGFAPNDRKYPFAFVSTPDRKYGSYAEVLQAIVAADIDGFEIFKPNGTENDQDLASVVRKGGKDGKRLIFTPGSDYHGGVTAGIGPKQIGGMKISPAAQEELKKILKVN